MKFRKLRSDEIEIRVQQVKTWGAILLLYKDARCDMNILDESNAIWKREHSRDNANCTVSIWYDEIKQWVSREDTGTESNTEKQKGLASDSFKRACFNWGIGRELYTGPQIKVQAKDMDVKDTGKKDKFNQPICKTYDTFSVEKITYDEYGNIDGLAIVNSKTGKRVFTQNPKKKG
jgi:hypothetical protein